MKRKIKQIAFLIFFGSIIVQSCDKIESPYRENNDTSVVTALNDSNAIVINGDTFLFPSDTTPNVKRVMAEDYTGHLCGNCPAAGIFLNDTLKNIFGNKLVVISVHAGFFAGVCPTAIPCPGGAAPAGSFLTDHRTTIGNDWNTFFGISGNPKGMIDRIDFPTSQQSKSPSSWSGLIQSESNLAPDFKIRILNHFNPVTGQLLTAVQSTSLASSTADLKLQLVLTEDSVIDWQEWYSHVPEYVPDFIHHHMLRDAITSGSWGMNFASGNVAAGTIKINGFSHTINPALNPNHCSVVAFIYDSSTKKIIQVEELPVR